MHQGQETRDQQTRGEVPGVGPSSRGTSQLRRTASDSGVSYMARPKWECSLSTGGYFKWETLPELDGNIIPHSFPFSQFGKKWGTCKSM